MEEKNHGPRRKKESPVTLFLAVVLLVTTLATPFVFFAPKARLDRAVEKTAEEFLDEDVLSFFAQVFLDGSFEAVGEKSSLSYTATLPKSAALVQQGAFGSCRVAFQGDRLYLQSSGFGDAAYSASRKDAAVQLCNSAFSDAGMPDVQMRLLRSALVLGDGSFSHSLGVLKDAFASSFRAGKPDFSAVEEKIRIGEKERKATTFTYKIGEEGVEKALAAWKRSGEKASVSEALTALRGILSATLSQKESDEAVKRFTSFLCGKSAEFQNFEKMLLSENSRATLTVTVYKGRVLTANFLLGGGDSVLEARTSLSPQYREDATLSFDLHATQGENRLLSLNLDSAIAENSKSALIRKWNWSYTDTVGAIGSDPDEGKGEITFSWGKEKGDLGLKIALDESELVFRGELVKYKKGKKMDYVIGRVEWNGKKISEDDTYAVTLSAKGETPASRRATENLFPEGEEREKMAGILAGRLKRLES